MAMIKEEALLAKTGVVSIITNHLRERYACTEIPFCKETMAMWAKLRMDYKKIKCNCVW